MSDKSANRKDPLTLLTKLGDTAEAVAFQLEQLGIHGRANGRSCPLARYLETQGYDRVQISDSAFQWGDGCRETLPPAAVIFVQFFDAGLFPELILNTEDE